LLLSNKDFLKKNSTFPHLEHGSLYLKTTRTANIFKNFRKFLPQGKCLVLVLSSKFKEGVKVRIIMGERSDEL